MLPRFEEVGEEITPSTWAIAYADHVARCSGSDSNHAAHEWAAHGLSDVCHDVKSALGVGVQILTDLSERALLHELRAAASDEAALEIAPRFTAAERAVLEREAALRDASAPEAQLHMAQHAAGLGGASTSTAAAAAAPPADPVASEVGENKRKRVLAVEAQVRPTACEVSGALALAKEHKFLCLSAAEIPTLELAEVQVVHKHKNTALGFNYHTKGSSALPADAIVDPVNHKPPADVKAADEGVIRKGDPGDFYMKVIAKKFRGVWHYGVITGVVTEWVLEDYGGATQWRAVFEADGDIVDLMRSEVVKAMAAAQEHPPADAEVAPAGYGKDLLQRVDGEELQAVRTGASCLLLSGDQMLEQMGVIGQIEEDLAKSVLDGDEDGELSPTARRVFNTTRLAEAKQNTGCHGMCQVSVVLGFVIMVNLFPLAPFHL
eukprot:jgi/Tetstr1/442025/TSEL_030206.t1